MSGDHRFRDQVRRLHQLGPRPLGEVLVEIIGRYPNTRPFVEQQIARYAEADPQIVRWLGADDWLDDRDLVRLVAGGRP
jgi:hypothetical protein